MGCNGAEKLTLIKVHRSVGVQQIIQCIGNKLLPPTHTSVRLFVHPEHTASPSPLPPLVPLCPMNFNFMTVVVVNTAPARECGIRVAGMGP